MNQADLISLLVLWHRIEESGELASLGYPSECPSCAPYRTSRQYDSDNGAFEIEARGRLALHVGAIVRAMPEPHRTALYVLARNRATGVSVWRSPRLPDDEQRRAEVVSEALEMFGARL